MNRLLWRLRWWWWCKRHPLPRVDPVYATARGLMMDVEARERAFRYHYDPVYREEMDTKIADLPPDLLRQLHAEIGKILDK